MLINPLLFLPYTNHRKRVLAPFGRGSHRPLFGRPRMGACDTAYTPLFGTPLGLARTYPNRRSRCTRNFSRVAWLVLLQHSWQTQQIL